jgi:hypothetical protein
LLANPAAGAVALAAAEPAELAARDAVELALALEGLLEAELAGPAVDEATPLSVMFGYPTRSSQNFAAAGRTWPFHMSITLQLNSNSQSGIPVAVSAPQARRTQELLAV